MKRLISLAALLVALAVPALCQVDTAKVTIRAILVDKELNQKPVPRLALIFVRSGIPNAEPISARTSFDGLAEVQLEPGTYQLSTPDPIEFQGKRYSWETELSVSPPETSIELSNDNAKVADATPGGAGRSVDDLAGQFKQFQNSVFTVWTEFGHGTGFVVDP